MKIIDMSHVMNVHTPGWVGYAGNKMYYAQNLQTQTIVAQRIDTALHVGTHWSILFKRSSRLSKRRSQKLVIWLVQSSRGVSAPG